MSRTRRRRAQTSSRLTLRVIGRVALAVIVALLIGFLIVRNAAIQLFEDDPLTVLRFWPPSGRAVASLALDQVTAANGIVGPQSRALLEQALRRSPLLADPILLAGLEASAANDNDRASKLMKEARRRDPRSGIARSWLFDYYLSGGQYAEGLREAGPLMVLEPDAQPAILTMLTALLQIPRARPALVTALKMKPWWRTRLIQQASSSPDLVSATASLLRDAPNLSDPLAAAQEQQALLQGVAAQGRYALARMMWLAQLPSAYRNRVQPIYDGNFRGWPGAPPFNWLLHNPAGSTIGRIDVPDLPERSALQISAGGDRSAPVADQLILLPPGRYTLSFKARRFLDAAPSAAGLSVLVRCVLGDALATLSFDPPAVAERRMLDFNVPLRCPAVSVSFLVKPGENPGPVDAQLTAVEVRPRTASHLQTEPQTSATGSNPA